MAWTHVNTGANSTGSTGTSCSVTSASVAPAAGDIVYVVTRGGNGALTNSSGGFTEIGTAGGVVNGSSRVQRWYKVATGSEPTNYTFTSSSTTMFVIVSVFRPTGTPKP